MSIWMGLPSVVIPQATAMARDQKINPAYERVFSAFSRSARHVDDGILLPRALNISGEELAIAAIKPLLTEDRTDWTPSMLIDCRSSTAISVPAPTYEVAAKTHLNSSLPLLLQGSAGGEVPHALHFLQKMGHRMREGCIVSAVQRVAVPDGRLRASALPLADAAAAITVFDDPTVLGKSFRILSIALAQRSTEWRDALEAVLVEALRPAGLEREAIRWCIAHRLSNSFLLAARDALPSATWLVRERYREFDFGCADPLVSLSELSATVPCPLGETGVVLFGGRFGAIGAVVLKFRRATR